MINQLIEFLSNIIEKKSVLESIKENLCLKDDITLEDLFYDFDISKQHEIKMEDFLQVCKNFGIFPTSDQIYLLFKKYDLDCDKVLNYTEFCQMILPIKKEYIMIISNRQINPLKNNEISSETKYASDLFQFHPLDFLVKPINFDQLKKNMAFRIECLITHFNPCLQY